MAKTWRLSGTVETFASNNSREPLSTSTLDGEDTYTEHVVQQGVLTIGAGYEDISLGTISTAKLTELSLSVARDVRVNGSLVFNDCTRLLLQADVTQIEIAQDAAVSLDFWVQFFA